MVVRLHGGSAVDKAPEGRPGHPRRAGRRERVRPRPLLRYRRHTWPRCCVASQQTWRAGAWVHLTGARVKQAATHRVFGFEIMPAPFVVAHLQVGLTMQELDAPLSNDDDERAGVFLTNALTGWEPTVQKPLPFPELEQERERADRVKQETPVLVILGNPPYNGFAGMAVDEERELSQAYRTTKQVRRPEGQGLNDLYVRVLPHGGATHC